MREGCGQEQHAKCELHREMIVAVVYDRRNPNNATREERRCSSAANILGRPPRFQNDE